MIRLPRYLLRSCAILLLVPMVAYATKKPAASAHRAARSSSHKGLAPTKATAKSSSARVGATKAKGSNSAGGHYAHPLPGFDVRPIVRESALTRIRGDLAESLSSPFLYPLALHSFFQALTGAEKEHPDPDAAPTNTVRILQFGDSHTAADIFTGELRLRIQEQFGDGGLGFQFPGHPFAGYHLAGSTRSQSPGWFTEGNKFQSLGDGDLGLGGISISTSLPNESISLETSCSNLQLHYLQQAEGGHLQFSVDGAPITAIDTAAADSHAAGTFTYSCSAGQHVYEFRTVDSAPVKLFGIVTDQPGVTWECLGINGAVAPLILRWNQALFTGYLRERAPNLIVLAYGTNESGSSAEHLESYPADLARILDTLHNVVPNASVLILGPADRAMAMRHGRHASWQPFAGTNRIIAMQKEACRTHNCAFWDTRQRMGGFGSMPQWVSAGWAQPDRVHLTGTGYRALADALYADLVHAYSLYQQQPAMPVQESSNGKAFGNP